MSPEENPDAPAHAHAPASPPASDERVPCPNCCRLAPVTGRHMGLIEYRCELCFTVGATPDPAADR